MKNVRQLIRTVILAILAVQVIAFSAVPALAAPAAEAPAPLFPETGSKTKTDGRLTIDYSHIDQGYVMVRAKKTDLKMQLKVKHGSDSVSYLINGDGQYETIPLQYGNGSYQFTLYIAQKKGSNKCTGAGSISLKCSMKDELSCFLYPNQYVNYDADSPLIQKARELSSGLSDAEKIARKVCKFVYKYITYDMISCQTISANQTKDLLPDIATAWETRLGVCKDKSAVLCAMLRSLGIHAKLVIGTANGTPHAWVVVCADGKTIPLDPTDPEMRSRNYQAERYY